MPLDSKFIKTVQSLQVSGMGTEHVGLLLYSLIRMTRPRNVLEVGMGYTTPFMAMALHDNVHETNSDISVLKKPQSHRSDEELGRSSVLDDCFFTQITMPSLHAIDNFAVEESSSFAVLEAIKSLGLESNLKVYDCDYRGSSEKIDMACFPIDFIWFDCGNHRDRRQFISEYWDFINPNRGLLLLHSSYKIMSPSIVGGADNSFSPGSVLNELKRQQVLGGMDANFEVLSLLEPHKKRQGSVTLVRKLPTEDKVRPTPYKFEVEEMFKNQEEAFPKL